MVVWWSKFGFLARIIVFKGASEHGRLTHEFLTILRLPVSSPRIVHHHFWGVSCWLVVTGTWLLSFLSVGNFMIPIDEHIFFRGVGLNHQPVIYHPHFYPLLCTITIYYHLLSSIIIIQFSKAQPLLHRTAQPEAFVGATTAITTATPVIIQWAKSHSFKLRPLLLFPGWVLIEVDEW